MGSKPKTAAIEPKLAEVSGTARRVLHLEADALIKMAGRVSWCETVGFHLKGQVRWTAGWSK